MKAVIAILMIVLLSSHILAASFSSDTHENVVRKTRSPGMSGRPGRSRKRGRRFCRLFKGPSRCADEPLPVEDEEPWCPYRMCAPSYVPARLCPASSERQATDKCKMEMITRDIYKCDGKAFGHTYVPIGCEKGTSGCKHVPTCSCEKIEAYTSKVYTQITPFKPYCGGGRKPFKG